MSDKFYMWIETSSFGWIVKLIYKVVSFHGGIGALVSMCNLNHGSANMNENPLAFLFN